MKTEVAVDRRLERLLESERSVLGGILINPDMLDAAQEILDERDFFKPAHRTLFDRLLRLANTGQAIDLLTLKQALTIEELEEVGPAYLGSLIDGVPTSTNVPAYAKVVREASVRRALERTARQILHEAESDDDADVLLEQAERALFTLRDRVTTTDIVTPTRRVSSTFQQLEMLAAARGGMRGVPTGLVDVDKDMRGMHAGNLIVLGARPSQGKSALALTVAVNAAQRVQRPALFFSLEMSQDELNLREITMRAQIDGWRVSHGQVRDAEHARLSVALTEMQDGGVHVIDAPGLTVGQIRAMSRRAKASMGLSVVVIDYLQLITPDRKKGARSDNRTIELGEMTRTLKILARDLQTPVLLLSQLSRASEQRSDKRPQLSDLRESGSIEQDADVVLLLFRPSAYVELREKFPEHLAEVIIAKQRNGPTGVVKVAFIKEQTRFADWTERLEASA